MSTVPTPSGIGCPLVLGALIVGALAVVVGVSQLVHLIVWAVN